MSAASTGATSNAAAAVTLQQDPIEAAHRLWVEHGWESAADGMAAVTAITRAWQIVQSRVDAVLKPRNLTFARYEVLMLLLFSSAGQIPMSKVGQRLQVHPTSVTNAVDRLQQAGLVSRTPHQSDARSTLVGLTELGRETALAATKELNAEVFEQPGMSPARLRTLHGVLKAYRHEAGDFA